jgi:hypothetical protein
MKEKKARYFSAVVKRSIMFGKIKLEQTLQRRF